LAEIPAFLVTWLFAENQFMGRIRSLVFAFSSSSAILVILLYVGYSVLIPITAIGKFFIAMAFILSY